MGNAVQLSAAVLPVLIRSDKQCARCQCDLCAVLSAPDVLACDPARLSFGQRRVRIEVWLVFCQQMCAALHAFAPWVSQMRLSVLVGAHPESVISRTPQKMNHPRCH